MKILRNIVLGFVAVYSLSVIIDFLGFGPKKIELLPLDHKFGDMQVETEIKYNGIIRLVMSTGICSGWVIDRHYAVTAAHCINSHGYLMKDGLKIFSDQGFDTQVVAKAMGYDSTMDMGLIEADFSSFRPVKTNFYSEGFPREGDQRFFSFGFPLGQKIVAMSDFTPLKHSFFMIKGIGHLIPGMSGGPTVNSEGIAVGINSAVESDMSIIVPIQGFLGRFELE